jgi:ABC-type phosphate/phosphonate transport system substrate-binding protein
MKQLTEYKIDFDHLEQFDDLVVVSRKLTTEDKREISEFLKAYREKEARSKKARTIHSRAVAEARKKVKATAKQLRAKTLSAQQVTP